MGSDNLRYAHGARQFATGDDALLEFVDGGVQVDGQVSLDVVIDVGGGRHAEHVRCGDELVNDVRWAGCDDFLTGLNTMGGDDPQRR